RIRQGAGVASAEGARERPAIGRFGDQTEAGSLSGVGSGSRQSPARDGSRSRGRRGGVAGEGAGGRHAAHAAAQAERAVASGGRGPQGIYSQERGSHGRGQGDRQQGGTGKAQDDV